MIDETFRDESPPPDPLPEGETGTADASTRWKPAPGLATRFAFAASPTDGGVALTPSAAGEAGILHTTAPLPLEARYEGGDSGPSNQRVEVEYEFGPGGVTPAGSLGAIARYVDGANFLRIEVTLSGPAPRARIVERVDGVDAVLIDTDLTDVPRPAIVTRGAVRLEAVGSRLRGWRVDGRGDVPDVPPAFAVDLAGPVREGGWGVWSNVAEVGRARVRRFHAMDLPQAVLPAPTLRLFDANTLGYALTPVTLACAPAGGTGAEYEWEVYPAEDGDFPDAVRDVSVGGPTRSAFVRPGFAYDARVRVIGLDGSFGGWTEYVRLVGPGEKAAPRAGPPMPADAFPAVDDDGEPIVPAYVMPTTQTAGVAATVSDAGRESLTAAWSRPRASFELTFDALTASALLVLRDLHRHMGGAERPFRGTHPVTNAEYACRFAADEERVDWFEHDGAEQTGRLRLALLEVEVDRVVTLPLAIQLDPTLD